MPSNINNVESYANAPLIMRDGAAWWAAMGTEKNKGTKMFSLSGQIQRVGILEVPLGTPTSEVVMRMGGGRAGGARAEGDPVGRPALGRHPGERRPTSRWSRSLTASEGR